MLTRHIVVCALIETSCIHRLRRRATDASVCEITATATTTDHDAVFKKDQQSTGWQRGFDFVVLTISGRIVTGSNRPALWRALRHLLGRIRTMALAQVTVFRESDGSDQAQVVGTLRNFLEPWLMCSCLFGTPCGRQIVTQCVCRTGGLFSDLKDRSQELISEVRVCTCT